MVLAVIFVWFLSSCFWGDTAIAVLPSNPREGCVPGINCHFVLGADGSVFVVEDKAPATIASFVSDYDSFSIVDVPIGWPFDFAGARLLVPDGTGAYSLYRKNSAWTEYYWDEFSLLPPIIPEGPIAILGLGGGSAARLLLHLWPDRELIGWDSDEMVIDKARDYFGLAELEGENKHGGGLQIHVADALSDAKDPADGFAGIVVDLFSGGEVIAELYEVEAWLKLKERLKAGGRIMINFVEREDGHGVLHAMSKAFPSEVYWRKIDTSSNKMALTGPLPDIKKWSQALPEKLKRGTLEWKNFQ